MVHRDIKPENILLHGGHALVADFGIALAASRSDGGTRMTETGMSLGTPHYMSPEQAMGEREITPKADIYALGCVLYEMLAGEPPFTGPTAQAIIARVMTEEPRSLTLQRHDDPAARRGGGARRRWRSCRPTGSRPRRSSPRRWPRPGTLTRPMATMAGMAAPRALSRRVLALGGAAVLLGGLAVGWLAHRSPRPQMTRLEMDLGGIRPDGGIALSPDGRTAVIGGTDSTGTLRLFVRRLDQAAVVPIAPVGTGYLPVISPDGQQVAFLSPPSSVRRMSIQGGSPVTLSDSSAGNGLDWGRDGYLYFMSLGGDLARVRATGGPVEPLKAQDSLAVSVSYGPSALPNGKGVLLTVVRGAGARSIVVMDLRTRKRRVLTDGLRAIYASPGRLLYVTSDLTLYAAPFDEERMEITGPGEPVGQNLWSPQQGWADLAASASGTLLHLNANGALKAGNEFVVVDRLGKEKVLPIPPAQYDAFGLSPDGRRVAAEVITGTDDGGAIVIFGLGDSVLTRLTFKGVNRYPTWTADGRRVVFSQAIGDQRELVWKPADGSGEESTLLKRPLPIFEVEFSRDGRWMIYREGDANGGARGLSLHYRALAPGGVDSLFYDSPGQDITPALSPDGHWLAYVSDQSGRLEVYVRPFPPVSSGAVWQVSTEGGTEPAWAHSGHELFYKESNWLVAAEVRTLPAFAVAARRRLFSVAGYNSNPYHSRYAVLPGDQQFLVDRPAGFSSLLNAVVVLNWMEGLGRK